MKRSYAAIVAAFVLCTLAACGSSHPGTAGASSTKVPKTTGSARSDSTAAPDSTGPSDGASTSDTSGQPATSGAPGRTVGPGKTTLPAAKSHPTTLAAAAGDYVPKAIAPLVQPARSGEGQWRPVAVLGGTPVAWGMSMRPLVDDPTILASAAVVDQTKLKAALFNGPLIPGPGPWNNTDHVMAAALPSLVAEFNGGFEFRHVKGGYFTEGQMVKPLKNDQATLGIRTDGTLALGVLGRDMFNDGSWVSLRQNLPPVVLNAKASIDQFPGTYWGDNFHGILITYRSGVCTLADGRLMYVFIGKTDINGLVKGLVAMGCQTAMELDINGTFPQFATFTNFGTSTRSGILLDTRMGHPDRSLVSSAKDFIAFFDPSRLPAGVVK